MVTIISGLELISLIHVLLNKQRKPDLTLLVCGSKINLFSNSFLGVAAITVNGVGINFISCKNIIIINTSDIALVT